MTDPHQPQAGTVRLLLSERASQALTDAGHECFIVAHRVMRGTEEPETMGRWALHLIPCSLKDAQAACNVALGSHIAKPITERQKLARIAK